MIKKPFFPSVLFAALAIPAVALGADWTMTGQGSEAVVTDCADCEEDIGIMFQCRGSGMGAKLMVMSQAQETVPSGPLVFSVDGENFTYRPEIQHFGLVGNVPWITLTLSDPLTDTLINGQSLSVVYNGGGIQYSLEGLYDTLSGFAETCGWGDNTPASSNLGSSTGLSQPSLPSQPLLAQPSAGQQPNLQKPRQPQLTNPGINIALPKAKQPSLGTKPVLQPLLGNTSAKSPQQPSLILQTPQQPSLPGAVSPPVTIDPELRPVSFPFNTRSGGGKVRAGPSIETAKVGSTAEMAPITILEEVPNSDFNGYPWFRIQYSGGVGFQWGGIICRPPDAHLPGTYGECTR